MSRLTRRGASLIELLVAVMILAVVVALVLTAVSRGREAARRAQCLSHLHGIGLALSHHQTTRGAFPVGAGERSFLWKLLPFVGEESLSRSVVDDRTAAVPIPGGFLCPSDSARRAPMSRFATSYAGNAGTLGREPVSSWDGVFCDEGLKPDDVTDGLSFTAAASEWIVGDGDESRPSRLGSITLLDGDFPRTEAGQGSFVLACESAEPGRTGPAAAAFKGSYWFRGRLGHSLYTHALPPNRPSCRAAPDLNAITAGSLHPGGSLVLMLDGSARFVGEAVSPPVWRALGTRAGAEAVAEGAY